MCAQGSNSDDTGYEVTSVDVRQDPGIPGSRHSIDPVVAAEPRLLRTTTRWLRGSRLGLVAMALAVGGVAGLGAVGFRWLIFGVTWLATGHEQFGQLGRVDSSHLPWLGIGFFVVAPVVGGLLYGPLIQRFASEARGHGVPEVMLAIAENGGRIRPPVTIVKAFASAICIGTGGSVGREGPIVQIGSAAASTLGQWIRMSENRLRIIVACGAAGGIAATFNAPITGLFFGFEIILREFSLDALFATALSAVAADLVSEAFFGSAPFFSQIPHDLVIRHDSTYLLIAVLGLGAGVVGFTFKWVLYRLEDLIDALWRGRPEWARPAVGGIALGVLLLALPQMYGVGYPVMDKVISGRTAIWLLVILMLGKICATSLSLSIGGSGGVFAPSLFTGAMGGMAFGALAHHIFGSSVSSPAIFGVVAMGGVFGAAAQAPLTAIASVAEMTGNFTLILPVMLTVAIATAVSKRLSYSSIYTEKLLRRGIDIERPKPTNVLQVLSVAEVMFPVAPFNSETQLTWPKHEGAESVRVDAHALDGIAGTTMETREPQVIFSDETLEQALRQLVLYGRSGLPVLSTDGEHLAGWVTRHGVLRALADRFGASALRPDILEPGRESAKQRAGRGGPDAQQPLAGYEIVDITISPQSETVGQRLDNVRWPPGAIVVAIGEDRELVAAHGDEEVRSGQHVIVLAPIVSGRAPVDGPGTPWSRD